MSISKKRTGNKKSLSKKKGKRTRKNTRKVRKSYKKRGGGEKWKTSDEITDKRDVCPICLVEFSETPNKAIYKTDCNHLMHNDCLSEYCEIKEDVAECPICRASLGDQCNDVSEFKDKNLGTPGEKGELILPDDIRNDEKLKNIFLNQP